MANGLPIEGGIRLGEHDWQTMKDNLPLVEGGRVLFPIDDNLNIGIRKQTVTSPQGDSVEMVALAAREKQSDGTAILHTYLVANGVLLMAGVVAGNAGSLSEQDIRRNMRDEDELGMLEPSDEDAESLLQYLGKAAGKA